MIGAPFTSGEGGVVPAAAHAVDADAASSLLAAVLPRAPLHVQIGAADRAFDGCGLDEFLDVALAALPLRIGAGTVVAIRQADASDVDALVALARLQQAHHATPPVDDATERARQRRLVDDPRTGVWLAHDGDRALGMLVLAPPAASFSRLHLPAATIHLPDLIVVDDARGRGVGSALLAGALPWVHAIGYRHVALHVHAANAPARRFWATRAFRTVAHQRVRPAVTS